jgi:TonB family protein
MEVSMSRPLIALLLLLIALTAVASAQVVPQRVRVANTIISQQIVTKVAPTYPPLARQAKIQGTVVLKVQISKSGDVESLQLISGHPLLAPAAIDAVKQWKYKPYLLNGEPVEVETSVTVNFTLSDQPAAEGEDGAGEIPGGIPGEHATGVVGVVSSTPGNGPNAPQRIRVSSGVAQKLLLTKVQPQYPQDAKDQHIQGVVVLQVIIDKEGNVAHIELISGPPELAPAALEAVKQWKYRPYLLNGTPLEVHTEVQVNFTLGN